VVDVNRACSFTYVLQSFSRFLNEFTVETSTTCAACLFFAMITLSLFGKPE